MNRDDGNRRQAVFESLEEIEGDDVEAADHCAACRVVGDAWDAQPGGGIDDAVIQTELVEPVVEEARHHRGRAVERVGRLPAPEAFHPEAALRALGGGQLEGIGDAPLRLQKPVGTEIADRFAYSLAEHGCVLHPMSVAVDDRVLEMLPDFFGCAMRAHLAPPEKTSMTPADAAQSLCRTMVGVKPGSLCYSSSAAFVPDAPQKRGDDAAHPAHEARFPSRPMTAALRATARCTSCELC